ncbi:hypothetical protein MTR67_035770 [Solanum verrucosum]|uniref:Uncharacterized protein n=1 Tax=Solanum verrucosum TaxID=315347 RepID=A0AAF0UAB7_SOLVR|nr:hypothetical protein MTR67_035770 [Solanum verrucosum]
MVKPPLLFVKLNRDGLYINENYGEGVVRTSACDLVMAYFIPMGREISNGETIGIGGPVSVASSGTNGTGEAGGTASPRASIGAGEAGTRGTGVPPYPSEGNLSL